MHKVNSSIIFDVTIKKLKHIIDERGWLTEILRCTDIIYYKNDFGQIYTTTVRPGVIKAWHLHEKQIDRMYLISGTVKLVLHDCRDNCITKGFNNDFILSELDPKLIVIPSNVAHGFMNIGTETAVILNVPTEPYNDRKPDEIRYPFDEKDFDYRWPIKMR
jgi:dTDP-4-dehydrorhamnose 3,5-epimerase